MEHYDLIVIGGGPAGYTAAERAGHAGLRTLLFEEQELGGVCLNEGCIPSKAFLRCAKAYESALGAEEYGVKISGATFDHGVALKRKRRAVQALVRGVAMKMRAARVETKKERAMILGEKGGKFLVSSESGGQVSCERLLIATGSQPVIPPIDGLKESLESGFAVTNREILDLSAPPARLAVVGGGVIGLEMASYYRTAGSEVTIVEMLDHIAGNTDPDLSHILQSSLEKAGVRFCLGQRVTAIRDKKVLAEGPEGPMEVDADMVLVCIGRRAATEGFGLETLAPQMERGAVVTDEHLCTSVPKLYAAGDVNGRVMLAHVAAREAEAAVHHMLGVEDAMRYDRIPDVIYTHPEAASVGLKEAEAREKGIEVDVVRLPLTYSGRYVAEEGLGGDLCKAVVGKADRKLLGVGLTGPYASEIIQGVCIALEQDMTVEDLRRVIFPHPTVSEIVREAMFALP